MEFIYLNCDSKTELAKIVLTKLKLITSIQTMSAGNNCKNLIYQWFRAVKYQFIALHSIVLVKFIQSRLQMLVATHSHNT